MRQRVSLQFAAHVFNRQPTIHAKRLWQYDVDLDGHDRHAAVPASDTGFANQRLRSGRGDRGNDHRLPAGARWTRSDRH